jgi:lipopolysaccharide export system protein LptA
MILRAHRSGGIALAVAMTMAAASAVAAQPTTPPAPNAFSGLQVNRDKPIQINATTLEVRDKDKKATFSGNVNVVQGDTTLKCKVLDVFYDQEGGAAAATTSKDPKASGSGQQIRRLEAKGGVTVIQKEQTATGETAIYDLKTNSVTLIGNVVVTQGQNVIRGDRIVVDLVTGVTRVESAGQAGDSRVQGLFLPNSTTTGTPKTDGTKTDGTKTDSTKTGSTKTAPKHAPNQPLKLN